jgi:hypothetical protein
MKGKSVVKEDPVVEEVRRIRTALWQEAGGTVAGLLRLLEPPKAVKKPRTERKRGRSIRHPQSGSDSTP